MPSRRGAVQDDGQVGRITAAAFPNVFPGIFPRMWQDASERLQSASRALESALSFAPPWVITVVLLVAAVVVVWLLHAAILAVLHRALRSRRPYLQSVLDATKNPIRFG